MEYARTKKIPYVGLAGFLTIMPACGENRLGSKAGTRTEIVTTNAGTGSGNSSGGGGGAGTGTGTCLKVVNGIVAPQIPGVVMLWTGDGGLCTGTFLGDNVVLTAAHCIDGSPTGNIKVNGRIPSIAAFHAGKTGKAAFYNRPSLDIALLLFPDNTSRLWRKVASVPPKAGDEMIVTGYGQTNVVKDNPPDGKVRSGRNTVAEVDAEGALFYYDSPMSFTGVPLGDESMSGRGDSGGPVFVGDGVGGLTSGGSVDNKAEMLYGANFLLFSAPGLSAMNKAADGGAHINGINNVRRAMGAQEKDDAPDTESLLVQDDSTCR